MPLPIILGALGLGAKLLGSFFGDKSKQKEAEAEREAQQRLYDAQKGNWDVGQNRRVGQLNAVQGLIQRTEPFLHANHSAPGGTGPDYTFDPAVLQTMQEKAPFSGAMPADPRAGQGYGALAGAGGGLGDLLLSSYATSPQTPVSGSALNPANQVGSNGISNWLKQLFGGGSSQAGGSIGGA